MKCRVSSVVNSNVEILTTGIFSVNLRDKAKIKEKQIKSIENIDFLLNNAMGIRLDKNGTDLMKKMLQIDGTKRISPLDSL